MAVTVLAPSEDSGRVTPTLKTGRRRLAVQPAPGKVDVDQALTTCIKLLADLRDATRHSKNAAKIEEKKGCDSNNTYEIGSQSFLPCLFYDKDTCANKGMCPEDAAKDGLEYVKPKITFFKPQIKQPEHRIM